MTTANVTNYGDRPDDDPCPKCTHEHVIPRSGKRSCSAHRSSIRDRNDELVPCRGTPAKGQRNCKYHGGGNWAAQRAGQRRAHEAEMVEKVEEAARVFGVPRQVDPAVGLIEEYWRCAGIVHGLERIVSQLDLDDLHWGKVSEVVTTQRAEVPDGREAVEYMSVEVERKTTMGARTNVWVQQFERERDRFAKLGAKIVEIGLEARRDEYVQAQVDTFATVLLADELALTPYQRQVAAALLRNVGKPVPQLGLPQATDDAA